MFNKFSALVFTLFWLGSANAQVKDLINNAGYDKGTNYNVIYTHDVSGKLYAHTRGFGLLFRQSKHVTAKTRSFYDIDIQSLKHPKEVKLEGEGLEKRRFVYGKLINAMIVRASLGLHNVLFAKADNKSIEVRYSYSIGPLLSIAKPYYVRVFANTSGRTASEETIRFNSENFSPNSPILGRAGFAKGLNQLRYYPGVSAKFNMSFEYAPFSNLIRALETGITLDYFPKALPLMLRNPAENLIFTVNLGFVFGTKWY